MIFLFETKKLLLTPVMIGCIVISLLLNMVIIIAYDNMEVDRNMKPNNVFEGLNASDIAQGRIDVTGAKGEQADRIREKYTRLQLVIDEKAANGDALYAYFYDETYYLHSLLFGTIFFAIIGESCLLALFSVLLSVTYENLRSTENIVYASKVGRSVMRYKLPASLVSTVICTAILLFGTLSVFLLKFDFSGVWNDNVSSSFNMAVHSFGKPFITWQSFSVGGYFWAVIGTSLALALSICLFGYAFGMAVKNATFAFIGPVIVLALMFLVRQLLPVGSVIRGFFALLPVNLWLDSSEWFTDASADILWANFETIGTVGSLALFSVVSIISTKIFRRREII
jgi:hypothetical protein